MKADQEGMRPPKPADAIGASRGLYYKFGRFGYPYYWNGSEWIRSDRAPELLRAQLNRKKDLFAIVELNEL